MQEQLQAGMSVDQQDSSQLIRQGPGFLQRQLSSPIPDWSQEHNKDKQRCWRLAGTMTKEKSLT